MVKKSAKTTDQTDIQLSVSTRKFPSDWEAQAEEVIAGMRQYQIDLGADRNVDSMEAKLAELKDLDKQILDLEKQLAQLRDNRVQQRLEIWQMTASTRMAVAGLYGMDSMEYQAMGGTRTSERKRPQRKPKPGQGSGA
jgi:hypothetical protein